MCDFKKEGTAVTEIVHPSGKAFAGSEVCRTCHQALYDSFANTSHFHTSEPATAISVKGSFRDGKNVFYLNNFLHVEMISSPEGLFQAGFEEEKEFAREPMDLVIGSGQKGQTYLYWKEKSLFQLPVSFFTAQNAWCASPGYPDYQILFNREVSVRCLECHTSFARTSPGGGKETYDRWGMILRVGCERCHGPSEEHVKFRMEHPDSAGDRNTINPARLSRTQQLDNCALCHSGLRENVKPSFSFITGDKLDSFSKPDYRADSASKLDVHGNQYGLLEASLCFIKSAAITCSTCHNPHQKETSMAVFSKKCMSCHSPGTKAFCKLKNADSRQLQMNCIDCHMPEQLSNKILMQVSGRPGTIHDTIRTHLIGIYLKDKGGFKRVSYSR